jgi:hypothetical protein
MDNARGSNKNTYVWGFLSNLVERKVFKEVYVSFLPVGHTHFGPDRIASRIAVGVRFRNVLTLAEFHDLIRRSHTPAPVVEHVTSVADWKLLMNPEANPQWTGARIKAQAGICSVRPCSLPSMVSFVSDTSSLHWVFSLDPEGKVTVQDRQIDDVRAWSAVTYPFQKEFREDDGNGVVTGDKDSGITSTTLSTLLRGAPNRPIPDTRTEELRLYINDLAPRLNTTTSTELLKCVDTLSTHREGAALHWADNGLFRSELEPQVESDGDEEDDSDSEDFFQQLANPIQLAYDKPAIQQTAAQQNNCRGLSLANPVHVDDHIAYKPFYNSSIPQAKRKSFYIGQVTALYPHGDDDDDQPKVQIQCFHTLARPPSSLLDTNKPIKYKRYNRNGGLQDVFVKDIFVVLQGGLPATGNLSAAVKRDIQRELTTRQGDPERAGVRCASG